MPLITQQRRRRTDSVVSISTRVYIASLLFRMGCIVCGTRCVAIPISCTESSTPHPPSFYAFTTAGTFCPPRCPCQVRPPCAEWFWCMLDIYARGLAVTHVPHSFCAVYSAGALCGGFPPVLDLPTASLLSLRLFRCGAGRPGVALGYYLSVIFISGHR